MRTSRTEDRQGARLGRPRVDIPNRPTVCPKGHRGDITRWGRREWTSAPFCRQRFRCIPADGSRPHTFSLGRRRAAERHPAGEECVTCDIRPGAAEGPISPVGHRHTAVEIAHLLELVAEGMSLRQASRTVRLEAHRYVEDRHGMRRTSSQHVLAARYLDLFGGAIDEALAPTRCPRILILDSKPLNLRAYGAERSDPTWNEAERGGAVMVAVGGDDPGRRLMPWRIGLAADETAASWLDFLDEIDPDGPGPDWVVADGASAIASAVMRRWPDATFYTCEFHLGRVLREAAASDGIWTDDPAHAELFGRALWSEPDWDALTALAHARPAPALERWCTTNDDLVRPQCDARRGRSGFPRSNAAAERVLDWIDERSGRRRRYALRNAPRLQLVPPLVRAFHAGQADLATFAAIVKRRLDELAPGDHLAWTAPRPARPAVLDRPAHRRRPRPRRPRDRDLHGRGQGARSSPTSPPRTRRSRDSAGRRGSRRPRRGGAPPRSRCGVGCSATSRSSRATGTPPRTTGRSGPSGPGRTTGRTGGATAAITPGSRRSVSGRCVRPAASAARPSVPMAGPRSPRSTPGSWPSGTLSPTPRSGPSGSR